MQRFFPFFFKLFGENQKTWLFFCSGKGMKLTSSILIAFLLVAAAAKSQIRSGFDPLEARDLIQICNSFGYLDLYGSDSEILPKGYQKVYTSPAYGMDNKFQIYTKGKTGVIHFRGSTTKQSSWLENLYASMIPVKDKISIDGKVFSYQVGEKEESRVHAGYTLAIYFFKDDLLEQIRKLNKEGIYDFYITGHSQGGALAQIVRAYFAYLPEKELSKENNFKVYAFANPMVGNGSFAAEYSQKYCASEMSFLIHNPADFVTKLPVSYNDSTFWQQNLSQMLMSSGDFNMPGFAVDGALLLFKDRIKDMAKSMSKNIEQQLLKELGEIKMPAFHDDINYMHTGNLILISSTEYPLELKDSTILQNDSLMKIYKRDANGVFENKNLYKNTNVSMQHKAYNYYTAIMKDYFSDEYELLQQKYFVLPKKMK